MKSFLMSAALISGLLLQGTASAQTPATTTATATAGRWYPLNVAAMTKDLALDAGTVARVTAINDSYNKEYSAYAGKATTDQVANLLKRRDGDLSRVLTPDQFKKWLSVRDAESSVVAPQTKAAKKAAKK